MEAIPQVEALTAEQVQEVRRQFPALDSGVAYLDGAAGTQVPEVVIEAISRSYRQGLGNTGGAFFASERSEQLETDCRCAFADLVGGDPQGVVLGPNMTTLTYRLSAALSKRWGPGDEVVVSQLDHDADVRPWVQAAERAGVKVRWARIDPESGELPWQQYETLVGSKTRLVAVTAASNLIGSRPEVRQIADIAHRAGALVFVDGVHATPHRSVDVELLGADFYATSAYKWCGPHVGALIASPSLLESIHPDKLIPSPERVPDRFEWGTPSFANYAGVVAAVEHLAALAPSRTGRRSQLLDAMRAIEDYESMVFARLLDGLQAIPGITLYGHAADRAPTAYFRLSGRTPRQVAEQLSRRGVNVWDGDNYAYELTRALGIYETGGAVRAGIVHYNDQCDVDRCLEALAELAP